MKIYDVLLASYEREVKCKAKHGAKAAIDLFGTVLLEVIEEHEEVPNGKQLYKQFAEKVNQQTGWGYKQLLNLLKTTMVEVALDN